ncbi:hypothetical protein J6590_054016 [Homalodisca vitripennis]|nr:hypothetical protein J6590_054016 [Homalodisca vitripennis]
MKGCPVIAEYLVIVRPGVNQTSREPRMLVSAQDLLLRSTRGLFTCWLIGRPYADNPSAKGGSRDSVGRSFLCCFIGVGTDYPHLDSAECSFINWKCSFINCFLRSGIRNIYDMGDRKDAYSRWNWISYANYGAAWRGGRAGGMVYLVSGDLLPTGHDRAAISRQVAALINFGLRSESRRTRGRDVFCMFLLQLSLETPSRSGANLLR